MCREVASACQKLSRVGMGDIEILVYTYTIIVKQEYHDYHDYCFHYIFTKN